MPSAEGRGRKGCSWDENRRLIRVGTLQAGATDRRDDVVARRSGSEPRFAVLIRGACQRPEPDIRPAGNRPFIYVVEDDFRRSARRPVQRHPMDARARERYDGWRIGGVADNRYLASCGAANQGVERHGDRRGLARRQREWDGRSRCGAKLAAAPADRNARNRKVSRSGVRHRESLSWRRRWVVEYAAVCQRTDPEAHR